MTSLGIFFIVILTVSLFLPYRYTFLILLLSCMFQISSVSKSAMIQPYLVSEAFIIFRSIGGLLTKKTYINEKITRIVFLFVVWSLAISYFAPNIFAGLPVVGKDLDEAFLKGLDTLSFGQGNIKQMMYVTLNFSTLIALYYNRKKIGINKVHNYFVIVLSIAVFFGYWGYMANVFGVPYPTDFLLSGGDLYEVKTFNDQYRMNGLCGEASFFGAFISSAFWALMFLKQTPYRRILMLFVLGCIMLNFSGSAYLTFLIGALIFIILHGVKMKHYVLFAFIMIFVILFLFYTPIGNSILAFMQNKQDSGSTEVRYWVTFVNAKLFVDSYGLGIGLGSSRSSSFIVDLLAGTGIIGTILFFLIYKRIVWPLKKNSRSVFSFIYLTLMLICMMLSIPDLSFCLFWFGMHIAILLCDRNEQKMATRTL